MSFPTKQVLANSVDQDQDYPVWHSVCIFGRHFSMVKPHLSHSMTKPTKLPVCPAKTQISLGIRPIWSESSLSAWRKLGSLATHWVQSEDWSEWADAQADPSLHWAHRHFVGFVMLWLIFPIYGNLYTASSLGSDFFWMSTVSHTIFC